MVMWIQSLTTVAFVAAVRIGAAGAGGRKPCGGSRRQGMLHFSDILVVKLSIRYPHLLTA